MLGAIANKQRKTGRFPAPIFFVPREGRVLHMMRFPDPGGGVVRRLVSCFGLAAAAVLTLSAASQRADALSLISPTAAPAAKYASGGLMTEVHGGHGGGGFPGGGGGGFPGGGRASVARGRPSGRRRHRATAARPRVR